MSSRLGLDGDNLSQREDWVVTLVEFLLSLLGPRIDPQYHKREQTARGMCLWSPTVHGKLSQEIDIKVEGSLNLTLRGRGVGGLEVAS